MRRRSAFVPLAMLSALLSGCQTPPPAPPPVASTKLLTPHQRAVIGTEVRQCWKVDQVRESMSGGPAANCAFYVTIEAETDASGRVVKAEVAPRDRRRVACDPPLQIFAERAEKALLSPSCSALPLPPSLLGTPRRFTFRFRP